MNTAIIKGNISQEIELRYLPTGTSIVEFSVAVNKKWVTDSGEKKEKVSFIPVKCWGKRGEVIAQYFQKGDPIILRGELDMEQWEDKTTQQKRSKLVLVVDEFDFCGGKKESTPAPGSQTRQQTRPAPTGARAPMPVDRRQQQPAPKRQEPPPDDFGEGALDNGMDDDSIPFDHPVALQA